MALRLSLSGRGEDGSLEPGGSVFQGGQLNRAAQHGLPASSVVTGQAQHGVDGAVDVPGGKPLQPLLLWLDEMKAGKPVSVAATTPYGCSVHYK